MIVPGRNFGQISGFKHPFVPLYHAPVAAHSTGGTQSFLPRDVLTPPYRVTRPFCRFDEASHRIAFDLDGREVWVDRDQVELEKGDLAARGQALFISLTLRSVRRVKIWYGPPPEIETANKSLRWSVKPLRLAVATSFVMFLFLLAQVSDPVGLFTASSRYSDKVYQQIYYSTIYPAQYAAYLDSKNQSQRIGKEDKAPRVRVIELLEEDLRFYDETWPVSYDFHAWVLDSILEQKPAAVFVDIAFIDDRSDTNSAYADYMQEVVESYGANGIPLLFAAPNCVRPFFLERDRVSQSGAKTMAVAVPGGRYHRQGFIYPLSYLAESPTDCVPVGPEPDDREDPTAELLQPDLRWNGLPSAGCALYVQATNRLNHITGKPNVMGDSWCFEPVKPDGALYEDPVLAGFAGTLPSQKLPAGASQAAFVPRPAKVTEILLHWSARPFEDQMPAIANAPSDGPGNWVNGRYQCKLMPRSWWARMWKYVTTFEKDEFRSPLLQTCPPQESYRVAQLLEGGFSVDDKPDEVLSEEQIEVEKQKATSLKNTVVIYAQNLLGDQDKISPPTHWPLPGAYFHATAADNLFTYGRIDPLLNKRSFWGVPKEMLLMLIGFLFVVPIWEYGFMIMGRIERLGSAAKETKEAFAWYGRWMAAAVLLPIVSGAVVLVLVLLATSYAGPEPLNFLGLFGLIFLRSLPRAWRLMPPLWRGLGGWRRGGVQS